LVAAALGGAGLGAAGLGGAALAAPPKPEGRAAALQKLADCRKLSDNAARLACYDAAAAEIDTAEAKGDIVVVDREQARQVRRQAFGFSLPSISIFERGEKAEEIDTLTGKVAAAHMNGAGKWVIRLEEGGAWTQIDTTKVGLDPRPGNPVKIRRASMGSYLLTVGGNRAFRAHRDE
jgi:hypothetical protein